MNIHEHQAKELLKKFGIPVPNGVDAFSTKEVLLKYLEKFKEYTREEIFEQRKEKFLSIGKRKAFTIFSKESDWVAKDNFFVFVKEILFKFKKELIIGMLLILVGIVFLI